MTCRSEWDYIRNKRRSNLGADKADKLMYIYHNAPYHRKKARFDYTQGADIHVRTTEETLINMGVESESDDDDDEESESQTDGQMET